MRGETLPYIESDLAFVDVVVRAILSEPHISGILLMSIQLHDIVCVAMQPNSESTPKCYHRKSAR